MHTTVEKATSGWRAETSIDLSDKQVLKLQTRSNPSGGIATWGSVHSVEGNDRLVHTLTKDFSTALRIDTTVRCTEKVVRAQHEAVLIWLDAIKQSVKAFYGPEKASSEASWQSYLAPVNSAA